MCTVSKRALMGATALLTGALATSAAVAQEGPPIVIEETTVCGPGVRVRPPMEYDYEYGYEGEKSAKMYKIRSIIEVDEPRPASTPCVSVLTGSLAPGEIINHGAFLNNGVSDALGEQTDGGATRNYNQNGSFFLTSTNNRRTRNAVQDSKVWVKGNYSKWDGDNNSFSGERIDFAVGADTKLSSGLVVGGLIGYGHTDFATTVIASSSFDSKATTIGAYFGKRFGNGVLADATFTYSSVDYDVRTLGGVTGSFDAKRYVLSGSLRRQYVRDKVTIEPLISVLYAKENQDAYTNSAAVAIPANSVEAGLISVGSNFYFAPVSTGNGQLHTRLGLAANYEFNDQNVNLATGLPDFDGVFSGRISAGFDYEMGNSKLSADAHVAGLGSGQYINYGLSVRFGVAF